jgi:hypothetical protein
VLEPLLLRHFAARLCHATRNGGPRSKLDLLDKKGKMREAKFLFSLLFFGHTNLKKTNISLGSNRAIV